MSFIAKNPLITPEVKLPPRAPQAGMRGLFAGEDGWYDIDSAGKTQKLIFNTEGRAATSADKLTTPRKITFTDGMSGSFEFDGSKDVNVPVDNFYESYLSWGGKDIAGNISPLDAAMITEMSANRLAFMDPNDIAIEYSRDGGATWLDYGVSNNLKIQLVTAPLQYQIILGKQTAGETPTVDWKLRVTITATSQNLYFEAYKTAIYLNALDSNMNVSVEYANIRDAENFISYKKNVSVSGWSGWNIIQLQPFRFGGTDSQTNNVRKIRYTFGMTKLPSNTSVSPSVMKIQMYGTTMWNGNNVAKTGNLYSFDSNKNVFFPAQLTATQFNGNATSAINDSDGNPIHETYFKKSNIVSSTGYSSTDVMSQSGATNAFADKTSFNTLNNIVKGMGTFKGVFYRYEDIPKNGNAGDISELAVDEKAFKAIDETGGTIFSKSYSQIQSAFVDVNSIFGRDLPESVAKYILKIFGIGTPSVNTDVTVDDSPIFTITTLDKRESSSFKVSAYSFYEDVIPLDEDNTKYHYIYDIYLNVYEISGDLDAVLSAKEYFIYANDMSNVADDESLVVVHRAGFYLYNGTKLNYICASVDEKIGDIDKALDSIITIQESLIGGESV